MRFHLHLIVRDGSTHTLLSTDSISEAVAAIKVERAKRANRAGWFLRLWDDNRDEQIDWQDLPEDLAWDLEDEEGAT